MNPSKDKQFALEVLQIFDELARPELKNRVVIKFWNWMSGYATKVILKKPDAELNEKLFKIYQKLSPKFQDVDMSVQIQEAEKLSGIKVPNVGELARQRNTVNLTSRQLDELMQEYNLG